MVFGQLKNWKKRTKKKMNAGNATETEFATHEISKFNHTKSENVITNDYEL